MSLKVGIVGLPNVGKSTLFNALLKKQQAYVANFPFATIEPNVGIVPVPDERLEKLADVIANEIATPSGLAMTKRPPIVPATVEFVDIAGIIAGAHKGEGLGNKFLSHIREVDAICHVVRAFRDKDVVRTGSSPAMPEQSDGEQAKSDFETVKLELDLADLEMKEKSKDKKGVENPDLPLFNKKPILVVVNVDEEQLTNSHAIASEYVNNLGLKPDQVIVICAKVEAELAALSDDEQKEYMQEIGISESGIEKLTQSAFKTLGLMTFLTAGEKEVRAWTIPVGSTAVEAAGTIHTDFMAKFIKAEIVKFEDYVELGGIKKAREAGKARLEGRDYVMNDGDVVEYKIGS